MATLETLFPPLARLGHSGVASDASRRQLLEHLNSAGLPAGKHEEYRFTPVMRSLEKYAAQLDWFPAASSGQHAAPAISGSHLSIVIDNGFPRLPEKFPAGISVRTETSSVVELSADGYASLNALLSPVTLLIESESSEDVLIHLHYVSTASTPIAINPSVRLILQENARLSIAETFEHPGEFFTFLNKILIGDVKTNAVLNTYCLQNLRETGTSVHHSKYRIAAGSTVNTFVLTTEGTLVRNNPVYEINGKGAVANLYGLYLLDGKTLADNHTVVDHRMPDANSNELYKGVMAGQSRGVFNGKIFVRQDAQKTNAFQSNRNILMSDTATVNTKPQLEIWADDVKCSHGCTIGQLDEEALFYLRSRGIDKFTAQAMLLDAFTGDVLQHITHEAVRDLFRSEALRKIASIR